MKYVCKIDFGEQSGAIYEIRREEANVRDIYEGPPVFREAIFIILYRFWGSVEARIDFPVDFPLALERSCLLCRIYGPGDGFKEAILM